MQCGPIVFFSVFQPDVFSITMDKGAVVLNAKGVKVMADDQSYNDGRAHFVITSVSPER